jgi:hypothetical protein
MVLINICIIYLAALNESAGVQWRQKWHVARWSGASRANDLIEFTLNLNNQENINL